MLRARMFFLLGFLAMSAAVRGGPPPDFLLERPLDSLLVRQWTSADALPTNALNDVLQTRDGYLWLTSFAGLLRFDGQAFTLFDRTAIAALSADEEIQLEGSSFYALLEDDDGGLWIGSQSNGLLRRTGGPSGGHYVHYGAEAGLDGTVRCLLLDRHGRLWVGMVDHGVLRSVPGGPRKTFEPMADEHLRGVTIRDFLEDEDGSIWVATEGKGLVHLGEDGTQVYSSADGLPADAVTAVARTLDGRLWVGTQEGLARQLPDGSFESVDAMAGMEIQKLYRHAGVLWLATEQGLFRRRPDGTFDRRRTVGGTELRSVNAITFGREGNVWVATYKDGLVQLRGGKVTSFTTADGLATERVNTVAELGEGRVWSGADNGTVQVIENGRVEDFPLRSELGGQRIRSILRDRRGTVWIASYAGLLRRDGEREELLTTDDGLPTNQFRVLYEDRRGDLWVGSRNAGLLHLKDGELVEVIDQSAGLASDFVFSFEEDAAGRLLIGTWEGLSIREPSGALSTVGVDDGLAGVVFNTHAAEDGTVYLATNSGLARWRDGEVRRVASEQGLPTDSVFDLVDDGRGTFWISSAIGLVRIEQWALDIAFDNGTTFAARLLTDADGLASRECTGATRILQASDGRLWIPTLRGLSVVAPDHLVANDVPAEVKIEHLEIDGTIVPAGAAPAQIPAGSRRIQVHYSVLSFTQPERVQVRYRLDGLDEEWVAVDPTERSGTFTGLAPGRYVFRMKAANEDGIWSPQPAVLAFRVLPRFHQTLGFRLAAFFVVTGAIVAFFRRRVHQVRRRSRMLEQMLEERRRLIVDLEARNEEIESYAYTFSHDLMTPLFSARGFLGYLKEDLAEGRSERVEQDLAQVDEAVEKMVRLLDGLLAVNRAGRADDETSGEVRVREVVDDVLRRLGGRLAERRAEVAVAAEMPTVVGGTFHLEEVFYQLIDNALKYTPENVSPKIQVGFRDEDDSELTFFVRDNGIGIEPRYQSTIFGLFDRLEADNAGVGVGLAVVRQAVQRRGGRVWVQSEGKGCGSTFCFTVPRRRRR